MAQSVEEYEKALAAEWDQWVAVDAIDVGNARAFNPGDKVPNSHVVRGVVPASKVKAVEKPVKAVDKPEPVEAE